MASATADLLIGKVVGILENEVSSIAHFRGQLDEVKLELMSMKAFLQDAESQGSHSEREKVWVTTVRDLVYDVEDVIADYMYEQQQTGGGFSKRFRETVQIPKALWYRRQIAKKLQEITKKIKAVPERNQRYSLPTAEGTSTSTFEDIRKWVKNRAESSLFINEDELVGIEGKKKILMGWLTNQEKHRTVISVTGMGGSGKTTIVAKTFTDERVRRSFDCYAWITVSQTYLIEDLLRRLIQEFHKPKKEEIPADLNTMSYADLLQALVSYLDSKRYLVVLDDVWDIKLWEDIKIALPGKHTGSRVMLTTRKDDVASHSFGVESHVFAVEPLEMNEAWELFNKKAFLAFPNKRCPPKLKSLAGEFVGKCEGLPLALVAISGLMSSKDSVVKWRKVKSSLNWHIDNNSHLEPVKKILLLSFSDLPYQLKHCFLYCSLFPEDYSIKRKRLIRLWIAEGFVEHVSGDTPEEVAESYLMELIFRNMLQVVEENSTGRPKACKMHDIMLELALSISEKEKFGVVDDGKGILENIGARRLSVQTTQGEIKTDVDMSNLRSFLVFVTDKSSFFVSTTLRSGLKLLTVLDLENAPIDELPEDVMHLFNLRYLNLRGTVIKTLPESIGRLGKLQILNICYSKIEALPRGISKLVNLRHLIMYRFNTDNLQFKYCSGTRVASNISELKDLQVLTCVESQGNMIRDIGNMMQLTSIGLTNVKDTDEKELCNSIQKLERVHYLGLVACDEKEFLPVNAISSPPPKLQKLVLAGKLRNVPPWFSSLHNLTDLSLHWTRLEEDFLPYVAELPCLGLLQLNNAYIGRKLCFNRGFVMLRNLELVNFPLLQKVTIEKGTMPNLKSLHMKSCTELRTLPGGIEHLANLKLLMCPKQLVESLREGGVDRPKIQHIPKILVYR